MDWQVCEEVSTNPSRLSVCVFFSSFPPSSISWCAPPACWCPPLYKHVSSHFHLPIPPVHQPVSSHKIAQPTSVYPPTVTACLVISHLVRTPRLIEHAVNGNLNRLWRKTLLKVEESIKSLRHKVHILWTADERWCEWERQQELYKTGSARDTSSKNWLIDKCLGV